MLSGWQGVLESTVHSGGFSVARVLDSKGVTLIELVVTMVVFGIVLAIAAYSFKDVLWRNQVNVAANELVTALNFARSEAVTRGQPVSVCRSSNVTVEDDPDTPVPSCSTTGGEGWETGYIVFIDNDGSGTRDKDETLLRVAAGAAGNITMLGNTNVADRIRYRSSGFSPGGEGRVAIANAEKTIDVILSGNGRVRTKIP